MSVLRIVYVFFSTRVYRGDIIWRFSTELIEFLVVYFLDSVCKHILYVMALVPFSSRFIIGRNQNNCSLGRSSPIHPSRFGFLFRSHDIRPVFEYYFKNLIGRLLIQPSLSWNSDLILFRNYLIHHGIAYNVWRLIIQL